MDTVIRDRLARFLEDYLHGTEAPLSAPCWQNEELAEAILDEFDVREPSDAGGES